LVNPLYHCVQNRKRIGHLQGSLGVSCWKILEDRDKTDLPKPIPLPWSLMNKIVRRDVTKFLALLFEGLFIGIQEYFGKSQLFEA
jgi:hypothetical protein